MDDNRSLRIWFLIFFSMCFLIISIWTGKLGVMIVGVFVVPILSFTLPPVLDLISTTSAFLIYGTGYSDPSYENRFYQDDMDRAKRLVREKSWNKAISAYREITQKAPKMHEARFNLASVYQMAGQLGLALKEYDKLRNLRDELGSNHIFVLESERIIEQLREIVTEGNEDFSRSSVNM